MPRIHYPSSSSMAARSKTDTNGITTGVLEAPNGERERVFEAFRRWGYLESDLDPLGFFRPPVRPELPRDGEFVREARRVYGGTVGVEFMHIPEPERRRWIQERMEGPQGEVDQQSVLEQLIRADSFEQVLQQRYLGTKRFSLEGVTALIPLVDEILEAAGQRGAVELVMGMSHRGRLTVIVQVAQRSLEEVFARFEDVDPRSVLGGGDVKYHMGATGEYPTRSGNKVHIHLVSNPSHLEAVDPVTIGRTRAKQDRAGEGGKEKYLTLLVHGDSAFAGQGIVAETLNFADLPGYTVGGTIHIIANNLIGFTTVCRRVALFDFFGANRAAAIDSDFPCERGRCGRGGADGAPRGGVPLPVRQRCSGGHYWLPAARAQRDRRSHHHSAAAVQSDQGASAVVGDLRRGRGNRGCASAGAADSHGA